MPSTTTQRQASSIDASAEPLRASAIPDTNHDGSQHRSTIVLSVMAPILMLATLVFWLLFSDMATIAGVVLAFVLCALVYQFPTQASSRFITKNFKRPTHFIPTVVSLVIAVAVVLVGAFDSTILTPFNISAAVAGNLAAFFLALTITTSGRYAMNYVAMTQRLFVLLAAWGLSSMVVDQTLLAVAVVGLAANLLWHIQSRWTPLVAVQDVRPAM